MAMFSFLCFTLTAVFSLAVATAKWQESQEDYQRRLGPFAFNASQSRASFNCPDLTPSASIPTSVHALRPGDIKYIAAMGDSLTAGNGAKAFTLIGLLVEYRGVAWSCGGDGSLKDGILTLPNIMKQFNPKLYGYSTGSGNQNSDNAFFNVAKPGGVSADMPGQAVMLVDRMKKQLGDNFYTDWKLVTFFIGGNDLCNSCKDVNKYTTAQYLSNVQTALDYLHANMPLTFVSFVPVLNVAELEDLHEGLVCQSMQNFLCDCAVNKNQREQVRILNRKYQEATNQLINSSRYDTKNDFTVVIQPFMEHMKVPLKPDGTADLSFFAPDCFHFSQKGHAAAATELWNNMMTPVGSKSTVWDTLDTLHCPPANHGFIYTSKNSS